MKIESMNPRHAAALALLGWYLMVPPQNPHWREKRQPLYDESVPLSEWDINESFDTAIECQALRDKLLNEGVKARNRTFDETHDEGQATVVLQNWTSGRCVSTDDPRLKGN